MEHHLTFSSPEPGESPSDLAGKFIGLAMKIHTTPGAGLLESVYEQEITIELTKAGLSFAAHKSFPVLYAGADKSPHLKTTHPK